VETAETTETAAKPVETAETTETAACSSQKPEKIAKWLKKHGR